MDDHDCFDRLIGKSAGMRYAVRKARILMSVVAPVLLQGETGVGKDVFARAIHDGGRHGDGPFVALNCGGLPRDLLASELFGYVDGAFTGARRSGMVGKIEAARGGTLFLDEISEMPLDLQPYLLRVLEGGEIYPLGSKEARTVEFRLVSACNRNLRDEVSALRFRSDLFYRVCVAELHIPALRDRQEDIPSLVEHFSRDVAEHDRVLAKPFAPDVLAAFENYAWPGNLRELRNVVEVMMLMCEGDVVGLGALPAEFGARCEALGDAAIAEQHGGLERLEQDAIRVAIRVHRGNLTRAAGDLRVSKSTLYLKMRKYGLEPIVSQARRSPRTRGSSPSG